MAMDAGRATGERLLPVPQRRVVSPSRHGFGVGAALVWTKVGTTLPRLSRAAGRSGTSGGGHLTGWITDPREWARQRAELSAVDRAEIGDAVSTGRAVRKPHLAPFVLREAQRHKVAGRIGAIASPLLFTASTAGLFYVAEGEFSMFAAVFGTIGGLAVAVVLLVVTSSNAEQAIKRNAAVLQGSVSAASDASIDSGGHLLLRRIGYWVGAFFIVSFLLRVSVRFVAALLGLVGVDVAAIPDPVGLAVSIPLLAWLTWRTERYLRKR